MSRQISAVPDPCFIMTWRLVESVRGVFDPDVSSDKGAFEQMWCVDWLWTETVYTKKATGCPQ